MVVKLTLHQNNARAKGGNIPLKNRIAALREEHGLTQQQLATMVETSRQTIISLESGKYNPSILLAHKIAKTFSLTIEEVFLFEEESLC